MAGELTTKSQASLSEALKYVANAWIPPNPEVVQFVYEELKRGRYDTDRNQLLKDLKKDFSLYGFAMKNLSSFSGENNVVSPTSLMREISPEDLHTLLGNINQQLSTHKIDRKQDFQEQQFRLSALSTSTTEVAADATDIDSDFAFSCAYLKQVGFMLVAWNYPRTYQKALLAAQHVENSLERSLTHYLGFSPTLLGIHSTASWSKSPHLLHALDYLSLEGADISKGGIIATLDENEKNIGTAIISLCELGDSFAKASDNKNFPTSPKEWDRIQSRLEQTLGPRAMQLIGERLLQSMGAYAGAAESFSLLSRRKAGGAGQGLGSYAKKLYAENASIKRLPNDLQKSFQAIYELIDEAEVSIQGMNDLVTKLIPKAGFPRGCIYMKDPRNGAILPRLRIGDYDIGRYALRTAASGETQSHPVLEALTCSIPIKQVRVPLFGDLISHITANFGNREKTGVLFLEMSEDFEKKDPGEQLATFKALKQTLNDILLLRGA